MFGWKLRKWQRIKQQPIVEFETKSETETGRVVRSVREQASDITGGERASQRQKQKQQRQAGRRVELGSAQKRRKLFLINLAESQRAKRREERTPEATCCVEGVMIASHRGLAASEGSERGELRAEVDQNTSSWRSIQPPNCCRPVREPPSESE